MITISILINGKPIYTRSAVNVETLDNGIAKYKLDDGTILTHKRDDGAVDLAVMMLGTIKEVK